MRSERLDDFVAWVGGNITGDEKGEAQIFLDRLFRGFGQKGCLDVGGTTEFRLRKTREDGGGVAFADYVWKPVVLIEMKKRGADLRKHYRQAFDYWVSLVPDRPRYVILCNFDEFWVYDFQTQMETPVDTVALAELPTRFGALQFLMPGSPKPIFANDREAVSRAAADCLARCFRNMIQRGVDRDLARRFILQMLVALFAEDIDLLPRYTLAKLLDECQTPADSYDLIGGLFTAMNNPAPATGGRFKGIPYFNGGLFASPAALELDPVELAILRKAAESKWDKVQPDIFGTIFQHSLDADERHAYGAHYTSPADIMKIVGPTIVEPWRDQIESAKTLARLRQLSERLRTFTVLDPACGSGNFLYIAYRELKRLEARLFERLDEFKSEINGTRRLSFLSAQNFYGIDILPLAVEIAKVTMVIARKLAIDEMHINEPALPLDNLDDNFRCHDALLKSDGSPADWPKADVIIGNPPFIGAKKLKPAHGPDYANRLRAAYPTVPGMADFCVYWLRKAHDHLPPCTLDDPVAGRAGLVGTQNIRNNQSRVGGLDHIAATGTIVEAVDNQPWSGEANVHVAIVNWLNTQDAAILPPTRKLWSKVEPPRNKVRRKPGAGPTSKLYDLTVRECPNINSTLSDQTDVSEAVALSCNTDPQRCFNGQMLGHKAFLLSAAQRQQIVGKDPASAQVIYPYLNGVDALTRRQLDRFVLDFDQLNQIEAATYAGAFAWVKEHVLDDRERKAKEGLDADGNMRPHHRAFLARWWQLSFGRPVMLAAIRHLPRFLACAYVTKRPIFMFVDTLIRPSNLIQVFAFADDYSFGILQAHAHWLWFVTKCGKLTERYRYSAESVFDTFPWPQSPTPAQVDAVAEAGRAVRRLRDETLPKLKGGLRALYRTLELPGKNPLKDAHAVLDRAVFAAYGFSAKADLLAQLLDLNQTVAARIAAGQPVTAPGIPPTYPDHARLISDDCIQPPPLDP